MDVEVAKGLCLMFLFIDTVIFGWPSYFLVKTGPQASERSLKIRATIISYLNCLGGGVFMGACLLHMLAEGREEMNEYFHEVDYSSDYPFFETLTAVGFFMIAAVEMIARNLLHKENQVDPDGDTDRKNSITTVSEQNPNNVKHGINNAAFEEGTQNTAVAERRPSASSHDHGADLAKAMQAMGSDPLQAFLLLAALSFHTIFDGLAVGLAEHESDVWSIFTAIVIHKSLVALCLGNQLFLVYREKPIRAFLWILLFAAIAPIGVGIGMILTSGGDDHLARQLASWILQGLATGTFLYVTFFEILRDEFCGRNLLKLAVVILGFGAMAIAKVFEDHDHGEHDDH